MWKSAVSVKEIKNRVYLGGPGSGKSEIAMNTALSLAGICPGKVHLFDLDQTKPLLRSRDAKERLERGGVCLHYEKQIADEPVQAGGVITRMLDPESQVILDVGGGDTGARLIGGLSHLRSGEDTTVYYVINCYRPWSDEILHVDETLSSVLRAARVRQVHFLADPTLGPNTTEEEVVDGMKHTQEMLRPYAQLEAGYVLSSLYEAVKPKVCLPLYPLELCGQTFW